MQKFDVYRKKRVSLLGFRKLPLGAKILNRQTCHPVDLEDRRNKALCAPDAFWVAKAERYDIKGKKYISTPYKYYFSDIGLRNARLNFRQIEETHIMENVIYNELCLRGYSVDVGVVEIRERDDKGNSVRKQIEVDFVCNQGSQRYYIQSALALPSPEKVQQELRPLRNIPDSFKKIVIVKDDILIRRNEDGIVTMGLKQFLLDERSLEV